MSKTEWNILVLPGDGIGPEVMTQTVRVLEVVAEAKGIKLCLKYDLAGGCAIDAYGTPLKDETLEQARVADAVLFGSVGGPKWEGLGFDLRPEIAILRLRKELNLYANLRPATLFEPLIEASTLKPEVIRGLDLLILRECAGGLYFGEPRGIETLANGERRGFNTEGYSTSEIERVGRVAFETARGRRNKVCSVEKANVTESGLVWREVMTALHQREFADVELSHMYADNCAMQLVRAPLQFDVIVTGNMFGDILSDLASMLTGSLGMLPSATIGPSAGRYFRPAVYEPIHGSAPDIAGKGIANPMAQILSVAMMLRLSFGMPEEADLVEQACIAALAAGARTADLDRVHAISTEQMGNAVLRELKRLMEGRT